MLIHDGLALLTVQYSFEGTAVIYTVTFSEVHGIDEWYYLISLNNGLSNEPVDSGSVKIEGGTNTPSMLHAVIRLMIFIEKMTRPVGAVSDDI